MLPTRYDNMARCGKCRPKRWNRMSSGEEYECFCTKLQTLLDSIECMRSKDYCNQWRPVSISLSCGGFTQLHYANMPTRIKVLLGVDTWSPKEHLGRSPNFSHRFDVAFAKLDICSTQTFIEKVWLPETHKILIILYLKFSKNSKYYGYCTYLLSSFSESLSSCFTSSVSAILLSCLQLNFTK